MTDYKIIATEDMENFINRITACSDLLNSLLLDPAAAEKACTKPESVCKLLNMLARDITRCLVKAEDYETADEADETEDQDPINGIGLLSISEAAAQWGLDTSTLRRAIIDGRLVEGRDCHKIGKQWAVTKAAMTRLYGTPKAEEDPG